MAETYTVKNIEEASALAQQFKKTGKYNLFRGEGKNWTVIPTSGRLNGTNYNKAIEKLKRLYYFFQTNLPLKKFTLNIDWFFAIAQHYGLPTNYIDFSTNPDVAAYFATNSKSNKQKEPCVIICLNEDKFNSFVDFTKVIYKKDNLTAPYISKPNVNNLWRLQAQEGCFLYTPYFNIELIYNFDRIIFPYSKSFDKISKEKIYPEQKSELEIYLDHYFDTERRIEGQEQFQKFIEEEKIPKTFLPPLNFDKLLKANKTHNSWNSPEYNSWVFKIAEVWTNIQKSENIILHYSSMDDPIKQIKLLKVELSKQFCEKLIKRNWTLEFQIISKPKLSKKLSSILRNSCSRIWHGTRNLPYTDDEILTIISKYVCFEIYENKFGKVPSLSNEELIVLELINEYGSKTRCYASPTKIVSSFRQDLKEILIPQLTEYISSEILLRINKPDLLFDFNNLLELFKEELVPYQVLYNSENNNPVIYYTPTQITVIGYA